MLDNETIKDLICCLLTIDNELDDSEKKGLEVDRKYIKILIEEALKGLPKVKKTEQNHD